MPLVSRLRTISSPQGQANAKPSAHIKIKKIIQGLTSLKISLCKLRVNDPFLCACLKNSYRWFTLFRFI